MSVPGAVSLASHHLKEGNMARYVVTATPRPEKTSKPDVAAAEPVEISPEPLTDEEKALGAEIEPSAKTPKPKRKFRSRRIARGE
jgi:hypothetical protein